MADALSASIFIGEAVSSGTSGSVLFVDVNGHVAQNNASFSWDNTNLALSASGVRLSATGSTATNVFLGQASGNFTTTGYQSVGVGFNTLTAVTTGFDNNAVGWSALSSLTTGYNSNAFGGAALQANTTGFENCAFGWVSLNHNTTGNNNCAFGNGSLYTNVSGIQNVAVGLEAMYFNLANGNTAVGYQVARTNSTGTNNTAVGYQALYNNVLSNSTAVGYGALTNQNGTGANNSGFGNLVMNANTTGTNNCAFGDHASFLNQTGSSNCAFGYQALYNSTVSNQTAVGTSALTAATTGANNTAVGQSCLSGVVGGASNTAIGFSAGATITSGSQNVFIGSGADANANNLTNACAIGFGSIVTASNTMLFGGSTAQTFVFSGLGVQFGTTVTAAAASGDFSGGTAGAPIYYQAASTCLLIGSTTFSGNQRNIQLNTTAPGITFIQSGATANNKFWDLHAFNATLTWSIVNDASSTSTTWLSVGRNTTTVTTISLLGNMVAFGTAALATNATAGFVCAPSSAGAPTGVPASIPTGQVPFEYDTTNDQVNFYNSGWKAIQAGAKIGCTFTATANASLNNSNAETSLIGTGVGTKAIAANTFTAGKSIRIRLAGFYTTGVSAQTLTIRIKVGTVVIASISGLAPLTSITNLGWEVDAVITCRTTGAAGAFIGQARVIFDSSTLTAALVDFAVATATSAVDTTASETPDITFQTAAADAGATYTCTNVLMEVMGG